MHIYRLCIVYICMYMYVYVYVCIYMIALNDS